jgi:hypothetical protein
MLLALLLLTQNPVTVRLNHDQFDPGDRARVYVQTAQDGYLVVLHADPEGRIRVLFPLDPTDDAFVRGGKKFEIRDRSDRDAFQIESSDGSGTVLAAVSPDAFNFGDFVRNDHWDFRALGAPSGEVRNDPLARLTEIAQKISGDSAGRFDYDYATYVVNSREIAARYGYGRGYYPHYGFGYYYNPFFDPFCADPFYGWSASCYAFGVGWGYSGGYRFGFGYGYGYPIYRPYRPYRPYIFASTPGPRFAQPRMVIPNRPSRYIPTQVRPRVDPGTAFTNPGRGNDVRPRDIGKPNVAPRVNGTGPSRASSGGSRPSVSRGSSGGGGSRPAPRSSGGSRGGGGGGGRRH